MFDSLPPDPRMPPGIDDIEWYEAALLVLALEECDSTHHPFVVVQKRAGYRWESAAHMSSVLASKGIVLVGGAWRATRTELVHLPHHKLADLTPVSSRYASGGLSCERTLLPRSQPGE